jgi:inosose dehydratase
MTIGVASAPVSWGIMESVPFPPAYPYGRVLDEIAQAGYAGTELGPYGFLPTEPAELRRELERRQLTLCSAFVALSLAATDVLGPGLKHVERTAKLLNEVNCRLLILSDEISDERSALAGRCCGSEQYAYGVQEWQRAKEAIAEVLEICEKYALSLAFHHHVGTHVETPEEIERLLSLFSPEELGLCLDTGHCVYGGGDPVVILGRHMNRLRCLHLKDIDGSRLKAARAQQLDFHTAVRHGVFAPLGRGVVDFRRLFQLLGNDRFQGWLVVEQDTLGNGQDGGAPLANAVAGRNFLRRMGL